MTVYLDSVFALNFAVNWLLLRAAARLGRRRSGPGASRRLRRSAQPTPWRCICRGCGVLAGWAGKLAVTAALLAVAFGLRRETPAARGGVRQGVTRWRCAARYTGWRLLKHGAWYPARCGTP